MSEQRQPIFGCSGCAGTAGIWGCPTHGNTTIRYGAAASAGADPEPHRDYAGRTCTTGLLHSHPARAQGGPSLDVERLQERDRLLQAKVREYAVALAIASRGNNSEALREAEAWLARLSVGEPRPEDDARA